MPLNWIKIYNRFFQLVNTPGETYHSGSQFLGVIREVDPDALSYTQLIESRNAEGKSTSRKDYYYDVINEYNERRRIEIYKAFADKLSTIAPDKVAELRDLLADGPAGPAAVVPAEVWNADRLTEYLEEMDRSIVEKDYNRTLTLSYTCLEGFFKAFIRARIPTRIDLVELTPMVVVIRDHIRTQLQGTGVPFPEQMITLLSTITNAVCNSRNHFSDAHFADESDRWLAEFARDCVNSIVRMLLKFI